MITAVLSKPRYGWVAAFGVGLASVLGYAPFGLWPLPFLSLAGLYILWQSAGDTRTIAIHGLGFGAGAFLGGVSWVYVSLADFSGLPPVLSAVATLAFCLYLALFPALAGFLFGRWRAPERHSIANAGLFAGLWTITEWLRGTLFTGFPWLAIGYSQTPPSPFAGWAGLLGVYGLGLLVALAAALLGQLAVGSRRRPGAWALIIALPICGLLLYQVQWTTPVGEPVRVNLLQGNVPQSLKWDPQRVPLSIDTYVRLANSTGLRGVDLTVLPETSLPIFFDEVPRDILRALTRQGDTLLGIAVGTRSGGYTNAAVGLSHELKVTAYAKQHLVPFGEYPPPGFAWFFKLAHIPMSNFTAGPPYQPPLRLAGQRIAPNVCYEDLFGEELIRALPEATLLINLSNTAWFGDSLAQPQHLQIAQMRALETGRTMLRATNTGMTAMVTPDGKVAARLEPFTRDVLSVSASGYSGLTPYARTGNLGALLLALLCGLGGHMRRNKVR